MANALWSGAQPESMSSTLSDTSSTLPAWLQEMTRALGSQASTVAGGGYTPYTQPTGAPTYGEQSGQIAGFNPMQQQAFQATQANQGIWQPQMNQASQTVPQAVGSYMNPYQQNVMDVMAKQGQRNLTENLLPGVNSTFTGAGQFGSTRNADFTNRALRDTNESIMNQQAQLAQQGFTQAQNTAMSDMQRLANLGLQKQNAAAIDVGLLSTAGQQQQTQTQANLDAARKDWQTQADWQKNNLGWLSDIIRGLPSQSAQTYQSSAPTMNTISPLMAAAQGFAGTRSLTSPTTTTQNK